MTTTRSASERASSWSWVMSRVAMSCSRWMRRTSSRISTRSRASSADSGSSSSSACGLNTSARASATRCCWPPESCAGRRSANPASPTWSRAVDRFPPLADRHPAHAQRIGDVFPGAHVRKQRIALEHDPQLPLLRRHGRDVLAADQDAPALGRQEAGEQVEQGGLARADAAPITATRPAGGDLHGDPRDPRGAARIAESDILEAQHHTAPAVRASRAVSELATEARVARASRITVAAQAKPVAP